LDYSLTVPGHKAFAPLCVNWKKGGENSSPLLVKKGNNQDLGGITKEQIKKPPKDMKILGSLITAPSGNILS
jgi:hypothetical protein